MNTYHVHLRAALDEHVIATAESFTDAVLTARAKLAEQYDPQVAKDAQLVTVTLAGCPNCPEDVE